MPNDALRCWCCRVPFRGRFQALCLLYRVARTGPDRHGKEGVAGSSPAEGFTNRAAARFSCSWSGSADHFLDAHGVASPGECWHTVRRAWDRRSRCGRPRRDHPPWWVGRVLSGYRSPMAARGPHESHRVPAPLAFLQQDSSVRLQAELAGCSASFPPNRHGINRTCRVVVPAAAGSSPVAHPLRPCK